MPTPFLESPRFPYKVAFGFSGGSGYSTGKAVGFSGDRKANVNWSNSKGKWRATHQAKRQTPTDEFVSFFHAVRGSAYGFRFRDWTDYIVAEGFGILTTITLNTTWQMYKRYTFGSLSTDRKIVKPVPSLFTIVGSGSYSTDTATGIVTRNSGANPTGWYGKFDVPCVFVEDELDIAVIDRSLTHGYLYSWNHNIEEIRIRT